MKRVLVTGAAGFIGTHLVEHILKNTDWEVTCLDRFDAAGNPNRLEDMLSTTPGIDRSRVKFVFWDLKAEFNEGVRKQLVGHFDHIMHLAAGSHVDRSIDDPLLFFQDNTIGTVNLLNYAREEGLAPFYDNLDDAVGGVASTYKGKFLYFSTDEVYGPYPMGADGGFKEWDRLNPNNPYAAAKAGAEMAVIAFANTYRMPSIITNTMNVFGERQDPEKFVPMLVRKSLKGEKVLIHANKDKTQAGQRHYIHARNVSSAVLWVLDNGKVLDGSAKQGRYNIVGEIELDNLELAKRVHEIVRAYMAEDHGNGAQGIPALDAELVDFHSSRPGHDLRYALDGAKLKAEGFEYASSFEQSLAKMVHWTLEHKNWL